MVMKCFCLQYYWNISQLFSVYCTSISTLLTFQCSICASPHQSMVAYTGHFRTYVILSFCQFFSSYECKNEEWLTGCRCKLSALSKHVKLYDKLWFSLSEAPFSIAPTARPLYFVLIQPKCWHFCDKIKLLDSCRWKYEQTQGEKHLASCFTCKPGICTLSFRINEHPYWIKLCYVQSTDTCVKYHFKQLNNKWAILKNVSC